MSRRHRRVNDLWSGKALRTCGDELYSFPQVVIDSDGVCKFASNNKEAKSGSGSSSERVGGSVVNRQKRVQKGGLMRESSFGTKIDTSEKRREGGGPPKESYIR